MVQRQMSAAREAATAATKVKIASGPPNVGSAATLSKAGKEADALRKTLEELDVRELKEIDESVDADEFMSNPTEPAPETFDEYAALHEKMLALSGTYFVGNSYIRLDPGQVYYLVSDLWVEALIDWQNNFEEAFEDLLQGKRPVPKNWKAGKLAFRRRVDNSDLVERYSQWGVDVVENLIEGRHFHYLDEDAWRTLMAHFGGGPEIARRAVATRKGHGDIDVRGIPVKVVISSDLRHFRRANVSKADTVKQVLVSLCRRYDVDPKDARLWDFYAGRCHACLDKPEANMHECDITDDQYLFIELAGSDGSFLLDPDDPPIRSALPASAMVGLGSRSYMTAYNRGVPAKPGLVGLFNLRNTCYMNSTLQCLSNIPQLRDFFFDDSYLEDLNDDNPLGTGGRLAHAFADLIKSLWEQATRLPRAISPGDFKQILDDVHPDFAGFMQHDAQELLSYMLDDLHEDVNRVRKKPYTEAVEANGRPDDVVAREAVAVYKLRNDSLVADLCSGMLMSKVACPRPGCSHESVTFDPYLTLALPVEAGPAKSRIIEVTVVPFETPLQRNVLRVESPVTGPVTLLRNIIGRNSGYAPSTLLLAEIVDHKIIRVLQESMKIESVAPSAILYAYENPATSQHLDMLHGDFTRWFREPMGQTGDEILVDENYLDYMPVAAVTGTSAGAAAAAAARQRNAAANGTVPPLPSALKHSRAPPPPPPLPNPDAMLEGIDHIKVELREDSHGEQTAVTIETHGPDVSTLPGSQGLALGKFPCPFQKRQIWLGHLEPYSFATTRLPLRMEVVHVELVDNEYFRVYMLLDINRIIPRTKNGMEQETRLLVGEYVPTEMVEEARAGGQRGKLGRRGANGSGNGSSDGSDPGGSGKDKAKGDQRKSLTRFSPRNVSKALFGGLARRNSKQRGGEAKQAGESELRAVDEENGDDLGPAAEEDDDLGSSASGGDESTKEDGPLVNNMGEVYLDAGPWKAYYYSQGDPSYMKRTADFKVRAAVDEEGSVFYGKVIIDGGYQTTETMAFFLRLAPPEMMPYMDLSTQQAQQVLADRRCSVNNTRGIRSVSRVNPDDLDPTHPYAKTDFCLDPQAFIVDCDVTEAQVFWMVADHYVDLYNNFMQDGVKNLEDPPQTLLELPESISREDVARSIEICHAGRNYSTTATNREPKSGKLISSESDEPFFTTKHSFMRIINFWSPTSPVIALFALMDVYLEDRFGRGHLRAEEDMRIKNCLDLFCNEEKLSAHDSWYCSNCKVHTEAVKTLRIWSLPPVLILHLKRFSQEQDGYFSEKVMTQIDFPIEGLDLRKYPLEPESKENAVYDLCCVTNHYGGIGSGHYTCYARHETDGSWHEFDDDAVLPVRNLAAIASSAAYVLFYLRRDFRPETWGEPVENPTSPEI